MYLRSSSSAAPGSPSLRAPLARRFSVSSPSPRGWSPGQGMVSHSQRWESSYFSWHPGDHSGQRGDNAHPSPAVGTSFSVLLSNTSFQSQTLSKDPVMGKNPP